jgi:uncharacterized membrane protein
LKAVLCHNTFADNTVNTASSLIIVFTSCILLSNWSHDAETGLWTAGYEQQRAC